MKKLFIVVFLVTQVFAFGGFGVYGNSDLFSSTPLTTSSGLITVTPQSFDNTLGGGVFVYLDVLPIVDLEANIELAGNLYKFTTSIRPEEPGEFPWGRVSGYFTLRKKIAGIGVPFLAKLQLNGGIGYNTHTVTPHVTVDFIRDAFSSTTDNIETAADQNFGEDAIMKSLQDYMAENAIKTSGFHIQVGAHAKLLMFNLFANARYTIADNIVEGKSGFPSIWTGFAIGF